MKALITIGIVALLVLGAAIAYRGDPQAKGPNYDSDVHALLEAAIESGDYDAWVKIRQENGLPMHGRMFQVINAENFHLLAQMHEANQAGDTDKAAQIRSELGLGQGRQGKGSHQCWK